MRWAKIAALLLLLWIVVTILQIVLDAVLVSYIPGISDRWSSVAGWLLGLWLAWRAWRGGLKDRV
jgi:uncharacterized membrane protein required for colicin V production